MKMIKTTSLILLPIIILFSFLLFRSKELTRLPVTNNDNSLDSAQADNVYRYARYYPNGTLLSICIIKGNSEKYIGIERRNDSLIYIDNKDRIFEIGSITKSFTGIILAKLVYEGKVNQDEPIKNILPIHLKQSSLNGKEITLVNLANHTSGLPFEPGDVKEDVSYDRYNPYRNYSVEKLYNYLSNKMTLESTPGEKRTYSNLGFGLLGHILTLITGKSYEQLLFETICEPLKMQNTFTIFNDVQKHLIVQGLDEKGNPLKFDESNMTAFLGAGGIKSTAKDLVKYIRANMDDTTYFRLSQKPTINYNEHFTGSLAWAPYNEKWKSHVGAFGSTGGYTCGIIFERNDCVGVVVLSNVSPYLASKGANTEGLCRALYDPLPYLSNSEK